MVNRKDKPNPIRAALIWGGEETLISQRTYSGMCREAGHHPEISLRRFDINETHFGPGVLSRISRWAPHGFITNIALEENILCLRKWFPGHPVVAINRVPETSTDSIILADMANMVRTSSTHFRAQGARSVAFYFGGDPAIAGPAVELFLKTEPRGLILPGDLITTTLKTLPIKALKARYAEWFANAPKPVGIMTFGTHCGAFLHRLTTLLGWRIPEDVMLIGLDEEDDCLACTPHLSSISIPGESIGVTSICVLLQHLHRLKPPPEKVIRVAGNHIIARGSTGRVQSGSLDVATTLSLLKTDASKFKTVKDMRRNVATSSRRTFYRHFQSITGNTPAELLRETKLKEACRLLKETSLSVTLIAEKCGYGSSNYFAQTFRHAMKMTPREFRNSSK